MAEGDYELAKELEEVAFAILNTDTIGFDQVLAQFCALMVPEVKYALTANRRASVRSSEGEQQVVIRDQMWQRVVSGQYIKTRPIVNMGLSRIAEV